MNLKNAAGAWGTTMFRAMLKEEIERRAVDELPLAKALRHGNAVADEIPTVIVHRVRHHNGVILARIGLFFAGVDAGSCCANDPAPVHPHQEYCDIQLEIERATGNTKVRFIDE